MQVGSKSRASVLLASTAFTGALIAVIAGHPQSALAACDPGAADNVTATCSGTTTNQGAGAPGTSASLQGYGSGTQTNVTVTVVGGATLTGSDNGIDVGSGTFSNNAGATITGVNEGIRTRTGTANVTNSGTISGTGPSSDGIFSAADAIVTNNSGGLITGQGFDGVHAEGNATVTNAAGATISGQLGGVAATHSATVINSGSIAATAAEGVIAVNGTAAVTNNAGGTITGVGGVFGNAAANVINFGSITGGASGSGVGTGTGGVATVTNHAGGTISGLRGVTGTGGVEVVNSGTIAGTDALAGSGVGTSGGGTGNVKVTNNAGGKITGPNAIFTNNAANVVNSGTISASVFSGVRGDGGVTVFNNAGGVIMGGTSGHGIAANGSVNFVYNAGTIGGGVGAIVFGGSGNVLTLAPSSVITGAVRGTGSDTLQLGGSGAGSFDLSQVGPAAQYRDFATFNKIDSSTWTLAGTPSQAMNWTVSGGVLAVNGAMPTSSIAVNAGGTLGGIGTVGNTTINAGGMLAPGNSIGTINISGNLNFVGAGNYIVEVNGASSDKTVVSGTATLGGAVQVVPTARITARTTYTILSASPVSGTFGSATVVNNLARNPLLSYVGNDVLLTLDPTLLAPLLAGGTANQRSVAAAIDNAIGGGNPMSGFDALFALSSPALNGALDQLSGEVHPSTAGALMDESLYMRGAVLGRLRQASYGGDMGAMAALKLGGPRAAFQDEELESALAFAKSPIVTKAPMKAPAPSHDTVFWAQGFGAWGKFNGDGNAATVRRDLAGFVTGVDTRVGSYGRLGVAAGYTGSKNALDGRGSSRVDTGHIAGYGGWSFGAVNLRAGGAYAFHTIDTDRTVAFLGFADRLIARYDGSTGQVFGELGYGFALGNLALEPFAGAAWVRVATDAAAERGGLAALNVAGTTFETGYTTLGVRAAGMIPVAHDMMLIPRATLAWQHAFNDVTPSAVLAFQAAPTSSFVISGVPIARDALLAEAGLDLAIGRNATIGVSYTGQIASNVEDHAAKGKFSWRF
jgi:subtilase-type serine protease